MIALILTWTIRNDAMRRLCARGLYAILLARGHAILKNEKRGRDPHKCRWCPLAGLSARSPIMKDVTHILSAIDQGDPHAAEQLLPLVYDELRKLAAQKMAQEKPGQTLQATALVHEAYIRVVAGEDATGPREQHWDSRGHFFAAAAEAMRRILVENARRHRTEKRGGEYKRIELSELAERCSDDQVDLLALDEALKKLEDLHPQKAEIVRIRFFSGCTLEETASILGISRSTAQRHWAYARAWLFGQLNQS
jgi:RNA polymerase sigma factor (TIGR02999 family)